MTKKDLAKALAEELGIPVLVAQQAVQMTFDGITEALVKEGRIELRNFGVFEVKKRKPRMARNPRTGEQVMVLAKLAVTFKPGREMEEQVGKLKKSSWPQAIISAGFIHLNKLGKGADGEENLPQRTLPLRQRQEIQALLLRQGCR